MKKDKKNNYRQRIEIIEESVIFEKNGMNLYRLFSELFHEDSIFWKCLSDEKSYHAELFNSLRQPNEMNALPTEMLHENIVKLRRSNVLVEKLVEKFTAKSPSRQTAFIMALALETSGSARIFQEVVSSETNNKLINSFTEKAGFRRDHLRRIRTWMSTNNIEVNGEVSLL